MKKYWLFAFFVLAVFSGLVFLPTEEPSTLGNQISKSEEASKPLRASYTSSSPKSSERLPKQSLDHAAARLAPFLASPVTLQDGGSKRRFELATDELYLRQDDGSKRIVRIPRPNNPRTFAAAIEKVRAEHGAEPALILYPVGLPRNEYTRRIVTRQVVLNAPSRLQADALAAAQGLVFQKAPVFAPNAFVYQAPTSAEALGVQTRQGSPVVATTLLARKGATLGSPNDPYYKMQWHLKFQNQLGAVAGTDINVESVWNYPEKDPTKYNRGQNVTIGIVDDSFEWSHPDLAPNTKKDLQYDWNGKDNDPKPYFFSDAHGTSVGGVSAARGNNKIGVSGVAPEAGLAGMRLIADEFTDLDEAEAMLWKADQIYIKNNSWHHPLQWGDFWFPTPGIGPLSEAALKYAADFGRNGKGTILTFAAGNSADWFSRPDYKAEQNSIYTIAVGAVGSSQFKSYYSEEGACIVVSAPSSSSATERGVMTTDNKGRYGYNWGFSGTDVFGYPDIPGTGDATKNFGGTSSATPVVSGVVALMLQEKPSLGWRDVQEILMRSATKIDLADTGWKTPIAPDNINHSHKYGAGLVNAAAAVAMAKNWTNLSPQKSLTVTTNNTTPIAANIPNSPITRTFSVNGTNLRTEHVTLRLTVEDIKKGDLKITLASPAGTVSIFCLPHNDRLNSATDPTKGWADLNGDGFEDPDELFDPNEFENWTFMSVRNWGESSNGTWTLSITNRGASTGNLTNAELIVYGTPTTSSATTTVTVAASTILAPLSTNITLNATAVALGSNGSATGNITGVQFFQTFNGTTTLIGNGTLTGNTTNPATYTLIWNTANLTAGNYSITANATSSGNVTGTSNALTVKLDPILVAGWDFQTLTSNKSSVPLTTALMSARTYNANFGNGNGTLVFNGSNGSSQWNYSSGEIFADTGTEVNAAAGFSTTTANPAALLLRGGKNVSANGKSLVFRFASTANKTYTISYATANSTGGFGTHTWAWSNNATTWSANTTISVNSTISTKTFSTSNATTTGTLYLRLTPSGATKANGTNIIDNIQIQAN